MVVFAAARHLETMAGGQVVWSIANGTWSGHRQLGGCVPRCRVRGDGCAVEGERRAAESERLGRWDVAAHRI